MKFLEQDKIMRGNGCCFIYGGRLLWEGTRSRDLLRWGWEAYTNYLDGRHAERTQTQMQWVLRWVFSSPLSYPFHLQRLKILKKKKKSQNPLQLWFWKLIRLYQRPPLAQDMEGGSELLISSHGFWLTLLGQVRAFLQWCLCLFVLWLSRAQRLLLGWPLLPETPSHSPALSRYWHLFLLLLL